MPKTDFDREFGFGPDAFHCSILNKLRRREIDFIS